MHSHLLAGVDDGAPDIETAKRLIDGLKSMGYTQLITTPHIYKEVYPNTPEILEPAYRLLLASLEENDIRIRYAAEYFLDDYVGDLLEKKQALLTIHDNWVLVETSFVQPTLDLNRRLFDLQVAGYKPVLAHPERYAYWHQDKQALHSFQDNGVLLQVNLLSLAGYYGKQVAESARYLVKEGLVDLVGTDCHHERHVAALRKEAGVILKALDPLLRKDRLLNPLLGR